MPGNISAKSVPGLGPSSDTKVLSGHQDCPPTQESQLQDQQISRRGSGIPKLENAYISLSTATLFALSHFQYKTIRNVLLPVLRTRSSKSSISREGVVSPHQRKPVLHPQLLPAPPPKVLRLEQVNTAEPSSRLSGTSTTTS